MRQADDASRFHGYEERWRVAEDAIADLLVARVVNVARGRRSVEVFGSLEGHDQVSKRVWRLCSDLRADLSTRKRIAQTRTTAGWRSRKCAVQKPIKPIIIAAAR